MVDVQRKVRRNIWARQSRHNSNKSEYYWNTRSLEEKFREASNEWKAHCLTSRFHSMPRPYLDCDAYRRIVAMGPAVLPYIREEYARPREQGDPGIFWCFALREIIPDFCLPVGKGGPVERVTEGFVGVDIDEVQRATLRWLDDNIRRYIQE